jgi:hypothetical protein
MVSTNGALAFGGKQFGCCGRDTNRSVPPAQNRTSASTHTASALDVWRQSVP